MANTLLLDVDGVLIRDPLLLSHMRENVIQYVQTKVPQCKNPRRLNTLLMKNYGHTAIGLQKAMGISASDFDDHVYDRKLIDHLWSVISGSEFQMEAKIIHDIVSQRDWKVSLFSNAPLAWTTPVSLAINDRIGIVNHEYLKPHGPAYAGFSPLDMHIFVDDRVENLRPVKGLTNWHPIHFNEALHTGRPEFVTIGSIWEIDLITSLFQ